MLDIFMPLEIRVKSSSRYTAHLVRINLGFLHTNSHISSAVSLVGNDLGAKQVNYLIACFLRAVVAVHTSKHWKGCHVLS